MTKGIALQRTAFYKFHSDRGAKFVDFAGWEMPIQYTGIIAEHHAVREDLGLFDVSHMGEILIEGENASKFVQYLLC